MDDLIAMRQRGENQSAHDVPTIEPDETFWEKAHVVMPGGKASIHLRVDADILDWFKAQGKGHLTRMNAVLRSYVDAQRQRTKR